MWCHFEIFLEKSGPRYSARHKSEHNHKPTKKNHFWYCTRMYLNWCKCYWQPTQTVWLRWIGRGEFLAWIVLKKIKGFLLGFDLERYLACGIPAIPGNLFTLTLKKCVNNNISWTDGLFECHSKLFFQKILDIILHALVTQIEFVLNSIQDIMVTLHS